MKKKILMMAIALFGIAGATASAQETPCNNSCSERPAPQNKMRQPRTFNEFAFEGILLDINQQQRMDSLNAAVKANRPAKRDGKCASDECVKNDCQKSDCQKGDCKKGECTAQSQCTETGKCQAAGKDCKKGDGPRYGKNPKGERMLRTPYGPEYVAKVKEILTPEQFEMFQENVANMHVNMRKANPCMKEGARGAKMDKAQRSAYHKSKVAKTKAKENRTSKETN